MPIVTWVNEFSINVKEIDMQHQHMLKLVNNIHSSVEARINKNELKVLLIELVTFTGIHFATEEKYMKEYSYPGFKDHQKEHKLLLQHMNNLVSAVSKGKYPTFYSDYDISSDWALVHINDYDKELGVFLNSKNIY